MIAIYELKINGQTDPVGIEELEEFSWKLYSEHRNVRQKSYEMQIAADEAFSILLYDSGPVMSGRSVHVRPQQIRLQSATRYHVRVRVTSEENEQSKWKKGCFVTALLHKEEWKGAFLTPEDAGRWKESRGYYLRKETCIEKKVKEAFAFTTALGLYHFYINGEKIGEDEFTPGWTSYNRHLLYQCYDITDKIKQGGNLFGALIGAGWYKGDMGSARTRNHYGMCSAFSCHIVLHYEDGDRGMLFTDTSWECTESPILFSEIYDGEVYDARMEAPGWAVTREERERCCKSHETDLPVRWRKPEIVRFPTEVLTAQSGCKVKVKERIPAREIFRTPNGETVIDFGQNLAGWIEFKVRGKEGDKAVLRCFETLDKDGNVYFDNLRTAKTEITYICRGEEEEIYHPNFTYQGFRYAKVNAWPCTLTPDDFTACVLYSDMEGTGAFSCSDQDINQLHHNIVWSMKSNFLDIPTDCPQRDERLGWTGDAQIFCRTASYLMDTDLFYRKWLCDVAAEQTEEGGIPHVVPDVWTGKNVKGKIFENGTHSAAGWADAAVIIPWTLYLMYGDTSVIVKQYESMKAWIDFMTAHARDCMWEYRMQFGDWVALDAEEGSYYGATPLELTNMAYYAYSTGLFAEMARVVGKDSDAKAYRTLYEKIRRAYQERYFTEDGHLTVRTQTAHILTLYFDLVIQEYRENVVSDLLRLLKKENGHLVTGFMGTPHFCQVLSDNDHAKEAYELLLKDDFPSWLYQVKQGATTVWEHWDGMKPDGSMWSPAMNSFNHYAYGAVGDWLYRAVAGISCNRCGAGFTEIQLAPCIGTYLDYAGAVYESVHGRIVSRWERKENEVNYHFEIPCNTTAKVHLYQVEKVEWADGLLFAACGEKGEPAQIAEAGSGSYTVRYRIC
ncbi:MAG TPA: glycoside hydrolase family 78 protein [Candidatus Mediterraneibacter merdipullorum]|nr:glycoside hydrolase family 78 protein [Candidatus Mediterraneibacter merdipullorum]